MGKKIEAVKKFFATKVVWKRALITIVVIGAILALIFMDHACDGRNLTCESKSKFNININKGQ